MLIEAPDVWLIKRALPFWAARGFDRHTLGAWEGLDHYGRPRTELPKRMRVQARQAMVFAAASAAGYGDYLTQADRALSFLLDHAFDPGEGRFNALLDRHGAVLNATQDVYDLAFVLLAASHLHAAGSAGRAREVLDVWTPAITRHQASRGWLETPDGRFPRRQNPHMHLFEACMHAYEVFGDPSFLESADICLELLRSVFIDDRSGLLMEHFDAHWTPVRACEQIVEPGHMMEWVFLLDEYERVTGRSAGIDLRGLFDRAVRIGLDDAEFMVDQTGLDGRLKLGTRRLWPQTELLKAAKVLHDHGEKLPAHLTPSAVYERLYRDYLTTPQIGGWYDCFDLGGNLVSDYMPSSTLYHLYSAVTVLMR